VMMPTARLIKRLGELCDEYGIKLIVTSEEYTSKASFKHLADLPKYGEKPRDWNPRGKRISRDMYRNDDGSEVHADINAAGNILRKVADLVFTSRLFLNQAYSMIKKGALTDPKRYSLYGNLKRKYRSAALAHAGTSA
ncbi:MAG: zinc ribbon domain-containing protein, partial [Cyanobacteria bacterium P01_A01_bin.68]